MKSQVVFKRYIFIVIIVILFALSLYLEYNGNLYTPKIFNVTNLTQLTVWIFLIAISIIFELLRIKFYDSIITVQVMISLTILYLFGKQSAILFVIIYYFLPLIRRFGRQKSYTDLYNKLLKYAHHVILIILSANIFEVLSNYTQNKCLALFFTAIIYKILNFLIIDLIWFGKLNLKNNLKNTGKTFAIELWIYLSSIPLSILLYPVTTNQLKSYSILELFSIFYFIVIITFLIKSYSRETLLHQKLKFEAQKNKSISKKLKDILNVLKDIELTYDHNVIGKIVAEKVAKIFEFNYVLISKMDYQNDRIIRMGNYGISEKDFDKMKENQPPISFYKIFAKNDNKISNSYLISSDNLDKKYIYYPNIYVEEDLNTLKTDNVQWKKDNTLIIPIGDSENPIAYISLDQPQNGKMIELDSLRLLELFAENIFHHFKLLEKVNSLNMERLKDPVTSLYGIRYLERMNTNYKNLAFVDIRDFKKFNSKHGIEKSDEVLKSLAEIIKKYSRKQDIVVRYRGDWFLIFTNIQQKEMLERLKTISILANEIKVDREYSKIKIKFSVVSIENGDIKSAIQEAKMKTEGQQIY